MQILCHIPNHTKVLFGDVLENSMNLMMNSYKIEHNHKANFVFVFSYILLTDQLNINSVKKTKGFRASSLFLLFSLELFLDDI